MYDVTSRRLYLCTPCRPDLVDFVSAALDGGVDVIQLRDKLLDDRSILRAAESLVDVCHRAQVPFILNDRPDLALAVGADGVHVGQDDAPVELCRQVLGGDAIIGLSTHSDDDLHRALSLPTNYLSAGPIAATPTKPGREGTGVAYATRAQAATAQPVFVTGGVTPQSIEPLFAAGVRHFVVVRYLTEAASPQVAARQLRDAIDAVLP